MKYSEKILLREQQAERLLKALAFEDAKPVSVEKVPQTESREVRQIEESEPDSQILNNLLAVAGRKPAERGIHSGGKSRFHADWFEPLAKLMADGTHLRKAALRLGLHFSAKDRDRLCSLKEFQAMYRAYRRLFASNAWGRPNQEEILKQLYVREYKKCTKPRGAKYVSHPRKVKTPCPC